MTRKKTLLVIALLLFTIFIFATRHFMVQLNKVYIPDFEFEVSWVDEKIFDELKHLPIYYKEKKANVELDNLIKNVINGDGGNNNNNRKLTTVEEVWKVANSWVSKSQLIDAKSPHLKQVADALKNSKIIKADLDTRGTQLKLLLTLEGNQLVVFKPKWYNKDKIIEGPVYAGKDRYGSEIVGFHLSLLLHKCLAPISVERSLSLKYDVIPVATDRLLRTSFEVANRTCVYGKCFYCRRDHPICDNYKSLITGAVIFNIKPTLKNYRSPWQRTYSKGRKALWQEIDDYCRHVKGKLTSERIYDLVDTAIFDFLIQNGDRHHYETLNGTVLLLDNGKGLGHPYVHHIDILAPLYQCCMLRKNTYNNLINLAGGVLSEKLKEMPDIKNVTTEAHLRAMDERLLIIFATIEYCKKKLK